MQVEAKITIMIEVDDNKRPTDTISHTHLVRALNMLTNDAILCGGRVVARSINVAVVPQRDLPPEPTAPKQQPTVIEPNGRIPLMVRDDTGALRYNRLSDGAYKLIGVDPAGIPKASEELEQVDPSIGFYPAPGVPEPDDDGERGTNEHPADRFNDYRPVQFDPAKVKTPSTVDLRRYGSTIEEQDGNDEHGKQTPEVGT